MNELASLFSVELSGSMLTEEQWQALEEHAAKGDRRGDWRLGRLYHGFFLSGDVYVPAYPIGPRGGIRKDQEFTIRIDPEGGVHRSSDKWSPCGRGLALRMAAAKRLDRGSFDPKLDARLEAIWRACKT